MRNIIFGSAFLLLAVGAAAASPSTSSDGPVWIETTCDDSVAATEIAKIKQGNPSARDVAIGQGGVLVTFERAKELTAWDSDSSCHVFVRGPLSADTAAIARSILQMLGT
jgi:hypothetical protein